MNFYLTEKNVFFAIGSLCRDKLIFEQVLSYGYFGFHFEPQRFKNVFFLKELLHFTSFRGYVSIGFDQWSIYYEHVRGLF